MTSFLFQSFLVFFFEAGKKLKKGKNGILLHKKQHKNLFWELVERMSLKRLERKTANKLKGGEVISDVVSVVKELVE